ncbi:MAG: NUDIX hydrolase [Promethearchaeota archaeon]
MVEKETNAIFRWKSLLKVKKYESYPFNVVEKLYNKPDKKKFKASVLEMPDWVNIIAITPQKKIILIKQYRFGTDTVELEIPGGVIEQEEMPEQAARRELEEETGFVAEKYIQLGLVNSNPAIQTNKCYSFLAVNAQKKGVQHFDPDEYIEDVTAKATLDECIQYIIQGKITNCYIITAFFWYLKYLNKF